MGTNQEIISAEDLSSMLFDDYVPPQQEEIPTDFEELDIEVQPSNLQTTVEEEAEEETQPVEVNQTVLSKIVRNFVTDGTWDDFQVEHEGETYDSILDLIDKVEVTEEFFKGLVATQTEGNLKKLQEKAVILKDGIDPTRAEIARAVANGLKDYQPFIETYDNIIDPIKQLDLTEEQNAINLVAKFYSEVNKWDKDYISYKITQHKQDLELEDVAEGIRKQYVDSFTQVLEAKKQEQSQQEAEAAKAEKEAKKQLKELMKEKEYEDPFIAKAIPLIFAEDNGTPHWFKEIQSRMKDNDEYKIELAHWLLNTEDYLNKKIAPKKREEKLKTLQLVNILGAANKKKTPDVVEDEKSDTLDIFGI